MNSEGLWLSPTPALALLTDPATIRERTRLVFDATVAHQTGFHLDLGKLEACVDFVMEVTTSNYPSGVIPFHGRFEHLRAGGIDRVAQILNRLPPHDRKAQARGLVDAVVVSVLLDAGAGGQWSFQEGNRRFARSEGLAVASVSMLLNGRFSHDGSPSVTAEGLLRLTEADLATGFQVSSDNPMVGLSGRLQLLNRLGHALQATPSLFSDSRPGNLVDVLLAQPQPVTVASLLRLLLIAFSSIWPARMHVDGVGFGDVWRWNDQWIPFHKLSQWLTYSLVEPLEWSGVQFVGAEALTGLPEYRNGGLFLDFAVLALKDPSNASVRLEAGHPLIIEWRALTVQLLDRVGEMIRQRLGQTPAQLPLARILQGGTWAAGRAIAKQRRPDGGPPLVLESDGMVF